MFFKKKPKKTWLEMELERERKNTVGHVDISIDDSKKSFDEIAQALSLLASGGVTFNEARRLIADHLDASCISVEPLDASRIEVTPLYFDPESPGGVIRHTNN